MGMGGGVQIAVVDAAKISLARENQPDAKDFAEVAKELSYKPKNQMWSVAKELCSVWFFSTVHFQMFP